VRRIEPPELDAWDGGWERNSRPREDVLSESFGMRLMAVPDRDADGKPDVLATAPVGLGFVPAGVLSSANSRHLGRVVFSRRDYEYSNIGIALCRLGDVDRDAADDFAIGGASIRCWSCAGSVVITSGKTLEPIRLVRRADVAK
jgi:hypothetical protein